MRSAWPRFAAADTGDSETAPDAQKRRRTCEPFSTAVLQYAQIGGAPEKETVQDRAFATAGHKTRRAKYLEEIRLGAR